MPSLTVILGAACVALFALCVGGFWLAMRDLEPTLTRWIESGCRGDE